MKTHEETNLHAFMPSCLLLVGSVTMRRLVSALAILCALSTACQNAPATAIAPAPELPAPAALIARAKALEIDTPYWPPPGDPLDLDAAGFASVMCSAVFVTGLDPDFAAENVGYFTGPYASRAKLGKPVIDRQKKEVRVSVPNGPTRVAKVFGSQGCVTLPAGQTTVHFTPVAIKSGRPPAASEPWPMGDAPGRTPVPQGLDMAKVKAALDAAFEVPAEMPAAFIATWKGHIIAERYGPNITRTTPLESW